MSAQTLSPSQMQSVPTPAYIFISSVFTKFHRLLSFRKAKSFSDLPDDILLEIFTSSDYRSIISLRQTCRRCYRVSKTAAVWIDAFRWITYGADDWRTIWMESHGDRPSQELEALVSKMVRFERNWSAAPPRPNRFSTISSPRGFSEAFVPGGRWFLAATDHPTGELMYFDLDCPEAQGRTLLTHQQRSRTIREIAIYGDTINDSTGFTLAVEFLDPDQMFGSVESGIPREMTIWKVSIEREGELFAKLVHTFDVYRRGLIRSPLSLTADSISRVVCAEDQGPMFTIHRWDGLDEGDAQCAIIIPERRDYPDSGVRLLADGRVLAAFSDSLELYAPPERYSTWNSPAIPEDVQFMVPQWVFSYETPVHQMQHNRLILHYMQPMVAAFSVHNGRTWFQFRISLDGSSTPYGAEVELGGMVRGQYWGLGTVRAIRSTPGKEDAIFLTARAETSRLSLLSFAGVPYQDVSTASFSAPRPSVGGAWKLDEWSGRVVYPVELQSREAKRIVLYFAY